MVREYNSTIAEPEQEKSEEIQVQLSSPAKRFYALLHYGLAVTLFICPLSQNNGFRPAWNHKHPNINQGRSILTTSPNPIDGPSFFVRQHYLDFLNREPDSSGLSFWTNEIASCANDSQCTEVKRINVSAAFFLSIEFQQTGYLVERIYKAAYGNGSGTSTFGGTHQLPVPVVRITECPTHRRLDRA